MSIVQSGLPVALLTPFILATWIAVIHWHRNIASQHTMAAVETGAADPDDGYFAATSVDLNAILHDAVFAVNRLADSYWVRIELAMGAEMNVAVNPAALRIVLRGVLLTAINAASGGRVLITAAMSGDQAQIRITDDGPGADQEFRKTSLKQTEALITLQNGSVVVKAQPGRGTTVMIALPTCAAAHREVIELKHQPVLADQVA